MIYEWKNQFNQCNNWQTRSQWIFPWNWTCIGRDVDQGVGLLLGVLSWPCGRTTIWKTSKTVNTMTFLALEHDRIIETDSPCIGTNPGAPGPSFDFSNNATPYSTAIPVETDDLCHYVWLCNVENFTFWCESFAHFRIPFSVTSQSKTD